MLAYFSSDRVSFTRRFFDDREDALEQTLSAQAHQRIFEQLSPVQVAVVGAAIDRNQLILAGPGPGKTRLVVHRCAWLLQGERQPARSILVLCFNRAAALELRRRLSELIGDAARGVSIQTYHGLALRLTGYSLAAAAEGGAEPPDFEACLDQAIALLGGQTLDTVDANAGAGTGAGNAIAAAAAAAGPNTNPNDQRERLLSGLRHILVDEYQDIDVRQYQLVLAIAGRRVGDQDAHLSILAVGDDDQNIYGFRDTNVAFIRRFRQGYQAEVHHLVENYRSSAAIIACANALIAHNRDRMKGDHPTRIDAGRAGDQVGGRWQRLDSVATGRVQCLQVADEAGQAIAVVHELQRLQQLACALASGFLRDLRVSV